MMSAEHVARLKVTDTFALTARSLFFICGELDGSIGYAGYVAELGTQTALEFRGHVHAVEARTDGGVCLGFQYSNEDELRRWRSARWVGHTVLSLPSAPEGSPLISWIDPTLFQYARLSIRMLDARTGPVFPNLRPGSQCYAPHLRLKPDSELLGIVFIAGPEKINPGHDAIVTVSLVYHPNVDYSELRPGTATSIVEGRNTVASATILDRWSSVMHWRSENRAI